MQTQRYQADMMTVRGRPSHPEEEEKEDQRWLGR